MEIFHRNNFSYKVLIFLLFVFIGGLFLSPFFYISEAEAGALQSSINVVITVCGDGILDYNEVCDDGAVNNGSYGFCLADCSGLGDRCGDNALQSGNGEECDDGNTDSNDGCSSACQLETTGPVCGDGTCQSNENCGSCSSDCCSSTGGGGGGGGDTTPPPEQETKAILEGKAYPDAKIVVLKDGEVQVIEYADAEANFSIELPSDLTPGDYVFSIWGEDSKQRESVAFSVSTEIKQDTITTIGGIFIPPTISAGRMAMKPGQTLRLDGQSAPFSKITLTVESEEPFVFETLADKHGVWQYLLDTGILEEGEHSVRVSAVSPEGFVSVMSQAVKFLLGEDKQETAPGQVCKNGDINKDNKVDLVDFSILLYWWKKPHQCADQNKDGISDIIDFSIMLYYWTG